jgi:beta-glucosidase
VNSRRSPSIAALLLAVALAGSCAPQAASPSPRPIAAPTSNGEGRAAGLLARMTTDEKIGQITLVENGSIDPAGVERALVGGVLSGGDGNPTPNTPEAWKAMVGSYQAAALRTRLGIPILYGVDAVHGHAHAIGATVFPHAVGLGAANDATLVHEIGRATAVEMSATGIRWTFGPVVAVPQDVRWGRAYEGFGEDPALVAELGSALISGLQGGDLTRDDAVAATAKHFIGDGGTVWGTSEAAGYFIDQGLTDVDEATLRAIHLAPYETAVAAEVQVVMASFSSTRAGKVHGDRHLLTDVLKGELGFAGFVVSDWGGVDQVVPGDYDAAVAQSISAGIDMVMVPSDYVRFQAAVRSGLAAGTISADRLDDAVRRILEVKFALGLFERPMPATDPSALGSAEHRALARRAVAASAVLLRTAPGVLPIPVHSPSLLLAGAAADDLGSQLGGWSITWQGGTGATTVGTTLRAALADRLGDRLAYEPGAGFAAGTHAAFGIVVLAEPPYAEGRGDSATLELPAGDVALVGQMRPLVDHLIVVIYSGRPVLLEALGAADAVIAAWLPGTEGTGLADVLLGDAPFTGTTPYTWPLTPADAARTGRSACDGAVYPVGYGLDAVAGPLGPAACSGE